jgi:hypothetical protein
MKHQPWHKSTGPKTKDGKQRSSRNASKGKESLRSMQKMIRTVHKERLELVKWLQKHYGFKIYY